MEKICANHISDKRLISKIYWRRNLYSLLTRKQITQFKNGLRIWQTLSQRRHINGRQFQERCSPSLVIGKYTLKPPWGIIQHLWARPSAKRQEITNAGGDVQKREASCTAGETINWCSHYGKQYRSSSKS